MGTLWDGLVNSLASFLRLLESATDGVFGVFAWGWAIILLTFAVRLVLLPLAVKQTNSMRAMTRLAPEMKKIQAKYKVERSLMKTNPDKYRQRKQKQQEAVMALYKEHNVNPAASCLPLLLQMPILFALYQVLANRVPEFQTAPFYLITTLNSRAGEGLTAGIGVFVLLIVMGVTQFITVKQTMSRQVSATPEQMQQQKIMLYAMPAMFTVFGFNLPAGVLLYWVAQNFWLMAQQYVMFRDVAPVTEAISKKKPLEGVAGVERRVRGRQAP
ncbi:MAG: YidC/Oxa1 family membrane protein insertase [Egibacteraceae bacterium]